MEEIKCPGCGSGKVRKITEEKYECLACDNLFLIHSLSKEFRQTDEHIEKIHQDLKESIEKLNKNNNETTECNPEIDIENRYKSGMTLLKQGYLSDAQDAFDDIIDDYAWCYKGYYGAILCEQQKDKIDWNAIGICIEDMSECEDVPSDIMNEMNNILSDKRQKVLENLDKSLEHLNAIKENLENKTKQNDEMMKSQESALAEFKNSFTKDMNHFYSIHTILSIVVGIALILVIFWIGISLLKWIFGVEDLFLYAFEFRDGFISGIFNILLSCVRAILRVVISIVVIYYAIKLWKYINSYIMKNPKKDMGQYRINKMSEQIIKIRGNKNKINKEMENCQDNMKNINHIKKSLELTELNDLENLVSLFIEADQIE